MKNIFRKLSRSIVSLYVLIILIITISSGFYLKYINTNTYKYLEQTTQRTNEIMAASIYELLTKHDTVMTILSQQLTHIDPKLKDKRTIHDLLNSIVRQNDSIVAIGVATIESF